MGGCCSCDVTPDAPENIIPDPNDGEVHTFTVERCGWSGMSRDYQAFRGPDEPAEENRWLFLNKSGSNWGGQCKIAVENFVRGGNPDNEKEGEILWQADFKDDPYFQQYLRVSEANAMALMMNEMQNMFFPGYSPHGNWGNDDYYMNYGGGWARGDYVTSLFINWTMQSDAILNSHKRTGYGCPMKLGVQACGTAVARYYEVEEPIYEEDEEGNRRQVGVKRRWERDVREYVDQVTFTLVTAAGGEGYAAGQLLALPDGSPAMWSLPGDASDWTQNYETPYFGVNQTGGWFSKDPARITSRPQLDPTLCLLIGHLATTEFSAAAIKEALHPEFPHDPRGAVMFGMRNQRPPPQVIMVQQPYAPTYVNYQV